MNADIENPLFSRILEVFPKSQRGVLATFKDVLREQELAGTRCVGELLQDVSRA